MSDLVKRYRDLQISIGGCHDGYCVIKKPQGMHTNGGCNCLEDMKLHERSRVGGLLKYGQEMADRIEELEAELRLMKTAGIIEVAIRNLNVYEYMAHWERRAEKAEANLKKAAGALGDISNGEPEWPDDPQRELDWCRTRATTTLAELKGQDDE